MKSAALLLAGWGTWTLSEYVLHRWVMHGRNGVLSRPHRQHHAQPESVDGTDTLAARARVVLVLASTGLLGWQVASGGGLTFLVAWAAGYISYEVFHWRSHENEPLPLIRHYELWLRRRHLHHHFSDVRANYGVTVDLWDRLFGTFEKPSRLRVPLRLAPRWLMDDVGEVRAEYRVDYELAGGS